MGTRTAVFQEQEDGTYLGFYVHYDGYLEGVGDTLYNHYSNLQKVKELIDKKCALSTLGRLNIVLDQTEADRLRHNHVPEYDFCIMSGDMDNMKHREYYKAKSLEQIRRETYLTLNGHDEVQGFTSVENDEYVFKAYKGSDNNGFLYVQDIEGKWLVSVHEEGGYTFTSFQDL